MIAAELSLSPTASSIFILAIALWIGVLLWHENVAPKLVARRQQQRERLMK